MSPDAERRVLDELERSREEMLDFVSTVVSTPSVTGDEGAVAREFASWLRGNGFEERLTPVPASVRDRHPLLAGEERLDERPNVLGRLASDAPTAPPVVLNGHVDTVVTGPRELWEDDPFGGVRRGGRVWGRGAADMKGPIVAGLYAVRALHAAGVRLPFDVHLQCVVGEESSGIGTIGALATEPTPGVAIVLEPSDCVVCPACGGSLQFRVEVEGSAAHAAVPWTGVSALDNAILVYDAIRRFADARNATVGQPLFDALPQPAPYAVGLFRAGEWRATVPDGAVLEGRVGVMPGERLDDVRAGLVAAVADAAEADEWLRAHPPVVTWVNDGYPAWETPAEHPLVVAMTSAATDVLDGARPGAVTYGSDAGHFAEAGIPVLIFGPGRITDAHRENEYVEEEQVAAAARVLALALLRYAATVG